RQSPLTLAAFRPWGSSQDGRRAGSGPECSTRGAAGRSGATLVVPSISPVRLPLPAEDSPSGLWRSPGTRVGLTALRGSNPASSALRPGCAPLGDSLVISRPLSSE